MKTTYEYNEILEPYTLGLFRERINDCYMLHVNRHNNKRTVTINIPSVQIELEPNACVFVKQNPPLISNMIMEDWHMRFIDDALYIQSWNYEIQDKILNCHDIPILEMMPHILPDFVYAGMAAVIFNEAPATDNDGNPEYIQISEGFTWLNFREMFDFFLGRHVNRDVIPFGDQIFAFVNPNVIEPLRALYGVDIVLNMANQDVYKLIGGDFIVGKMIFGYKSIQLVVRFPTNTIGSVIKLPYGDHISKTLQTHRYNLLIDQLIRGYSAWSLNQNRNRMNKIID